MSIRTEELRTAYLRSGNVYAGSEKLGRIGQIYVDDQTSDPTWVTVKTGLFGTSESFVPLNQARLEGDDIIVDLPVALMERAAITGWSAANLLLAQFGLTGHDLHTVPTQGRFAPLRRLAERQFR